MTTTPIEEQFALMHHALDVAERHGLDVIGVSNHSRSSIQPASVLLHSPPFDLLSASTREPWTTVSYDNSKDARVCWVVIDGVKIQWVEYRAAGGAS